MAPKQFCDQIGDSKKTFFFGEVSHKIDISRRTHATDKIEGWL